MWFPKITLARGDTSVSFVIQLFTLMGMSVKDGVGRGGVVRQQTEPDRDAILSKRENARGRSLSREKGV